MPEHIKLVTEFDRELPDIMLDCLQFKQVFTNLASNAVRSMPEGGTLTVKTLVVRTAEGKISRLKEDLVEIFLQDTGCGMKKEVPGFLPLVGLVGVAVFVFSCFPIPVVGLNGMATAHPARTGMSAILLGPFVSVVIAGIALFIQALFLAHGGLRLWVLISFQWVYSVHFQGILHSDWRRGWGLSCSGVVSWPE
ncbi:ABC-type Co2+ transport system, permease component [Candidatus Scalindua japonica]|uniref:ABC-type Co2+ transport system, permease component n=1 Tax=Candidatus Scalindua japonica TaxID=1284222 RepID=A0A286U0C6_9BACT|nr:energy-coupling factor ABC transporter permease [Candidatus Scalindua japonica]GAX61595.1 ABC-type Co2+ transport system, permease component [Candidatus Scalindua japonica]